MQVARLSLVCIFYAGMCLRVCFAACQVAVNPMTLTVMTQLGSSVGLSIVDASDYCAR